MGCAYRGDEHGIEVDRGLYQEGTVHTHSDGSQEHEVAEGKQERSHPLLGHCLGCTVVSAAPSTPAWRYKTPRGLGWAAGAKVLMGSFPLSTRSRCRGIYGTSIDRY